MQAVVARRLSRRGSILPRNHSAASDASGLMRTLAPVANAALTEPEVCAEHSSGRHVAWDGPETLDNALWVHGDEAPSKAIATCNQPSREAQVGAEAALVHVARGD